MEQTQAELEFCPCLNFVSSYLIKWKSDQNSSWLYQYLGKNLNSVDSALAQIHNCGHTNLKVKQRQQICQTSKWRPKWLWVLYWEKPLPSKITERPLCTISVPKKSVVSTGPIRPFSLELFAKKMSFTQQMMDQFNKSRNLAIITQLPNLIVRCTAYSVQGNFI